MINFLNNLIPLILGHFVADFAIQTDTVALNKCPKNKSRISWAWWMTGHADPEAGPRLGAAASAA